MKILIVYESFHHGNTETIARVMAHVLDARLLHVRELTREDIGAADLIGFGSGIYFMQHHHRLLKLADELHPSKGKKAFLFSTSGLNLSFLFHRVLRKKLRAKGFHIVGEFSCRGFDTVGPLALIGGIARHRPDQNDRRKAEQFAARLRSVGQ